MCLSVMCFMREACVSVYHVLLCVLSVYGMYLCPVYFVCGVYGWSVCDMCV